MASRNGRKFIRQSTPLAENGSADRPLRPPLLSEEDGELTPSLKVKLRVVRNIWAAKVPYLFDEKGEAAE